MWYSESMPQLRQVHIENYRCLRSVDLDFEPLTVLVGAKCLG
jgi:predicted ATP-dependent endonuclease of OLD family